MQRDRGMRRAFRDASSAWIAGQPFAVVVDYSHTDDALRNAIVGGARAESEPRSSRCSGVAATATARSVR